jgi:hypothetical protein
MESEPCAWQIATSAGATFCLHCSLWPGRLCGGLSGPPWRGDVGTTTAATIADRTVGHLVLGTTSLLASQTGAGRWGQRSRARAHGGSCLSLVPGTSKLQWAPVTGPSDRQQVGISGGHKRKTGRNHLTPQLH